MRTLLVAAGEFGYGSAGKLAAIAARLDGFALVLLGSELGRPVLSDLHFTDCVRPTTPGDGWIDLVIQTHHPAGALVSMDAALGLALARRGLPMVFVDSLPYLWTRHDPVPVHAHAYCAQRCLSLPDTCWEVLRGIRNLVWVEGITPSRPGAERPRSDTALVSLGGLGSALGQADRLAYPDLVLPPTLRALAALGFRHVHVAGNLRRLPELPPQLQRDLHIEVSPQLSHAAFQELLGTASLLLASPGSTTILEAGASGTPTLLLPPQNLSQLMNAQAVEALAGATAVVRWPAGVVDVAELERVRRASGELPAVELMYAALERARGNPEVATALLRSVCAAVAEGNTAGAVAYAAAVGTGGAEMVAQQVRAVVG